MTLVKGSVIRGRSGSYTIIRKITEGGMAVIHLAVDNNNREVIVKSPKIVGDGNDDARLDKLKTEAEILRNLSNPGHQNIIKYVDEATTQNNNFHLVTERLSDITLKDKIRNHPLDERTALPYLQSLLDGIKYLHRRNVVHRDIKPGNILFDSFGRIVLIDFGGAKDGWTQMIGPATQLYTPGWSCPHQCGGEVSTSCDIYALGAVMFQMLTGMEPRLFMDSRGNLTKKPHDLQSTISQTISDLIKNMTDPEHRVITTVDDVESYLQRGTLSSFGRPHIILKGVKYELRDELDIGRVHNICDNNCNAVGFRFPPKVPVDEGGKNNFISKHHARIWKDRNGYFWIQDLRSKNGTALFKSGTFRLLSPGQKEMLLDKSTVALCHNTTKGPYLTFTFHER